MDDAITAIGNVPNSAWIDSVLDDWASDTAGELRSKSYPSSPSGSTYRRTGKLGRGWKAGQRGRIFNGVSYSELVVGENQAKVHRGRWWKGRKVVETEHLPKLVDKIEERMVEEWDDD